MIGKQGSLWGIRFNVFVSGAVVMALELVTSRVLAPVFGDSIFVWGALIGVVMAALALGYYVGGRLADRQPSYGTFTLILISAGILIMLIPLSSPIILEVIYLSGAGNRYGPLFASLLLLAVPTTLLGMVSPYSVRISAENIFNVGGLSGSLYSISTAGSLFGTFFTVFVLLPRFGVRHIVFSLGVVLIAVAVVGMTWLEKGLLFSLILILMIPSLFVGEGPFLGASGNVLVRKDTPYSTLTVINHKAEGTRALYLNNMLHSSMYLNGSNRAVLRYTDYFNIAFLFNPSAERVLFIGGGGFSGPKQFLEYYPNVTVDVVEIDPDVVAVAKAHFGVTDNSRLRVFVMDGRTFLREAGTYDIVVLDAYSKTYVPFHLMTIEFFEALNEHLSPDGVIVSNLISSLIGDTSDLIKAEIATIKEVFPQVYLFPTKTKQLSLIQNINLIATKAPVRQEGPDLQRVAVAHPVRGVPFERYIATLLVSEITDITELILTDDYAPAEALLNPITAAPYEEHTGLVPRSTLNPLWIAGIWLISLTSLYFISTRLRSVIKL
ncbi:spermidine synthase [Candidatus Bathyarchaeota archaeon]|jgi:spermidine synthase|nr:spermidine synthase [Candidatus Bathyarchaeota archaeon]MDP6047834.1 fused MFS/spermidine synthase [Candidatus Bathyarchaeota archaeon]MDP7207044.1 fused MFS/spermidine synthase [Candidatus Bathyarchaeota archaeon]MDP7443688.1 fused MFS/spermidine synthase [Candidatus Bathyarchaeota archaeon]|tara:strand:+ start:3728 stop:5377 length:1650 start_codon:yes stop_codon:yes gene_type:complete